MKEHKRRGTSLLENYIALVLTALAGLLIGLVASALAANEDSANSLLPFILIPQIVFAGVEIPLDATNRLLLTWGALALLIIAFTIVICIGLKRKDVRA